MASTYTTNQGIEKPAAGDQSGTWGGTVNTNMDIIDRAICGVASLTLTGSTTTLTTTDGTLTDGMYRVLILGDGGDLGSDNTITISPNDQSKCYLVYNNLTANRNAIFTQGSGGNITVSNGATAWIYADGAGAGAEVRQGMVSTEIADQDGDTKIQVEEGGDDDDTIRFDIAGAEDFTMTADTFTAAASSIVALDDGAVGAPALTNTGDLNTGVYFPAADTVGVVTGGTEQFRFGSNPIPGGSKNLVQNGAMTVNQHGSVAVSSDQTFTLDRYMGRLLGGGAGRFTVTQDTTVPAGEGFGYSLKVDVTTIDSSISGSEYYGIAHTIEAQNLQHLNFNDADAKSLTLTFWARAKKAGLHGGSVYNNDANRSLVFSWTAVADTWQKVTVPVPGDTSGVINNDNGGGLSIYWGLGAGNYLASDTDAWVAGAYLQVTSAVNDLDSTSNDFYLTGVQLEIGDVATDFEHEDIGTTTAKCRRYYHRIDATTGTTAAPIAFVRTVSNMKLGWFIEPKMRTSPSVETSGNADDYNVNYSGGNVVCSAVPSLVSASGGDVLGIRLQVASGPSAGEACMLEFLSGTATGYLAFDAEL